MTPIYGFGMLMMGLIAIVIASIIIYFIFKKIKWSMIRFIFIIGIVMTLTGCAKDIDLNPYTTIVRHMLTSNAKWLIN